MARKERVALETRSARRKVSLRWFEWGKSFQRRSVAQKSRMASPRCSSRS